MRCPNCYGKVDKKTLICTKCGFKIKNLEKASNKKAKELKRKGDGDLVIETNMLPTDLSKKNLLLFCGFLGLFGGHYFYVGKFWRGIVNLIVSIYASVFGIFSILKLTGGKVFAYFEYFALLFFGFVFIFTVFDFFNIIFNKFKVPVYIENEK